MKMKQLTVAMITLLLTASCSEKQQDYPFPESGTSLGGTYR